MPVGAAPAGGLTTSRAEAAHSAAVERSARRSIMYPGAGAAVGHWGVVGQDGSALGAGVALAAAARPGSTWSGPVVVGVSGATIRHVGCSTRSFRCAGALSAATGAGWAA